LQSLPHAVPQQNSLQTYALQAYAVPQQNLLQAYALQQYALQQYALQQYGFQAQLGASQSAALLPRQGTTQPTGLASADALRSRLDDLQDYIADQEKNGQLTPSQRRALRQQEKALTKQLRIAEKRAANSQKRQAYLSPLDSAE
jgi:hypothetical protein